MTTKDIEKYIEQIENDRLIKPTLRECNLIDIIQELLGKI